MTYLLTLAPFLPAKAAVGAAEAYLRTDCTQHFSSPRIHFIPLMTRTLETVAAREAAPVREREANMGY